MANLGFFGFIAAVLAIMGLGNYLIRSFAGRHKDQPWAQALQLFY
jgi:hypothetical protein